jgi:hypothetical protein
MNKEYKLTYKKNSQLCEVTIDEILICVYNLQTRTIQFYGSITLIDLKEIICLIIIFNFKNNETENKD